MDEWTSRENGNVSVLNLIDSSINHGAVENTSHGFMKCHFAFPYIYSYKSIHTYLIIDILDVSEETWKSIYCKKLWEQMCVLFLSLRSMEYVDEKSSSIFTKMVNYAGTDSSSELWMIYQLVKLSIGEKNSCMCYSFFELSLITRPSNTSTSEQFLLYHLK